MKKYFLIFAAALALISCGEGIKFTLSKNYILESSATGTPIGTLEIVNPPDGVTYTFEITDDEDMAFDIVDDKLVVGNGSKFDYEDVKTHEVSIKTTGSDNSKVEQKFTIGVLDIPLEVTNLNNSGSGSLRKVIEDAPSGSKIGFKSSLNGTIKLASAIEISKKIIIMSPGQSIISISGESNSYVLDIADVGDITISGVTIKNGSGTGINNIGKLSINYSTIKNNSGSFGGGINNGGTATIRNCTLTNNEASTGGALGNIGNMFVYDSVIHDNSTTGNWGAGIASTSGNLTVVNTTISGNTVNGNNRMAGGIGCYGDPPPAKTELYNVTITKNSVTDTGGYGGGVFGYDCTLKIKNSLIAQNTVDTTGPDVYLDTGAILTSKGYNLIGIDTNSGFTEGEHHDQVGTMASPLDPKLKSLADNGGPTGTHAFSSSTSPAIDQIPPAYCKDENDDVFIADQRGFGRPFNEKCDIGAFEAE